MYIRINEAGQIPRIISWSQLIYPSFLKPAIHARCWLDSDHSEFQTVLPMHVMLLENSGLIAYHVIKSQWIKSFTKIKILWKLYFGKVFDLGLGWSEGNSWFGYRIHVSKTWPLDPDPSTPIPSPIPSLLAKVRPLKRPQVWDPLNDP